MADRVEGRHISPPLAEGEEGRANKGNQRDFGPPAAIFTLELSIIVVAEWTVRGGIDGGGGGRGGEMGNPPIDCHP